MVSKSGVKFASMLLHIFWFCILLGNCIVSHVSLHLFFPNYTMHALSENDITKRKIKGDYF